MSGFYNYEFDWDSKYCYPNSNVLKNKLSLTNEEDLATAERELASLRNAETYATPISGNFDLQHLQSIHHFLFSDIYEWAGELRTVDITKGNKFCLFQYIENAASQTFNELRNEHYLIGQPLDAFIKRISYYLGEINAIHPFREGNGRAQRNFIECLGKVAGYDIVWDVNPEQMIEASANSFLKDYRLLEDIFKHITTPINFSQQKQNARLILSAHGPAATAFRKYKMKREQDLIL